MCGICGVWAAPRERAAEAVTRMVAAMRHRGPDDCGIYGEGSAAIGMARLAIIDASAAGHQPMHVAEGRLSIVYNGEVYNFIEERRILEGRGVTFASDSDTEVVLRMYEHYGDDFLLRLRGMFAMALLDRRRGPGCERLLVARDHLGIKPLLYARAAGALVFASEIKALLASGYVDRAIDPEALRMLLSYGSITQPRTMLRDVRMLPPGHRLIVEPGSERLERYWSLAVDRRADLRNRPYEALVDEVADVLREAVRLQLVSDVPLGAFLSGGVDSSLLVAMMSQLLHRRVKTFSVGFEREGAAMDESADAERMARHIGTDHTAVTVRGSDVRDHIERIARGLDQPSVDGVNAYFVAMAARREVTVAISGTGGDELFAGYPWFISMVRYEAARGAQPWRSAARDLIAGVARRRMFDPLVAYRGGGRIARARAMSGFVERYAGVYQIFGARGAARLIAPGLRLSAGAGRAAHHDFAPLDELSTCSPVERVTGLCVRGYLTNQLLRDVDAVSMAHSLEVRVPFLDPHVVDTALSLPDSAKLAEASRLSGSPHSTYRETGAKRVLIDVGRRFLPADFDLQPKRGFAMPFGSWLRGPLREVLDETLSPRTVAARGLLDPVAVSDVRDGFLRGEREWSSPWLLMMLELWCRAVLDGSAGDSAAVRGGARGLASAAAMPGA